MRRRVTLVVFLVAALVGGAVVVHAQSRHSRHGATTTGLGRFTLLAAHAKPNALSLPADCVPRSGPPYQLGAVGTFSNGTISLTPSVSVSGVSGTFCARATVISAPPSHPDAKVCASFVAPSDGFTFDELTATLHIIPGVSTAIGGITLDPGPLTAFVCDDAEPGPIVLNASVSAATTASLFGTECKVGPITVPVSGQLNGPLTHAVATVSNSSPFAIPALTASSLCPAGLVSNANQILGLPIPAGTAHFTITATAGVYLAG